LLDRFEDVFFDLVSNLCESFYELELLDEKNVAFSPGTFFEGTGICNGVLRLFVEVY